MVENNYNLGLIMKLPKYRTENVGITYFFTFKIPDSQIFNEKQITLLLKTFLQICQ